MGPEGLRGVPVELGGQGQSLPQLSIFVLVGLGVQPDSILVVQVRPRTTRGLRWTGRGGPSGLACSRGSASHHSPCFC